MRTLMLTLVAASLLGLGSYSYAESYRMPGSACKAKYSPRATYAGNERLYVYQDYTSVVCPVIKVGSEQIIAVQLLTSGIGIFDPSPIGCSIVGGSITAGSYNTHIFEGSSMGEITCVLNAGDRVNSLIVYTN